MSLRLKTAFKQKTKLNDERCKDSIRILSLHLTISLKNKLKESNHGVYFHIFGYTR